MTLDWQGIATLVAVYAAGLSTAAAVGNWRDKRPRLRVRLVLLASPRNLEDRPVMALEASNPGRVAVTVCDCGFSLPNKSLVEPEPFEQFEAGRTGRRGQTLITALPFTVPPGERATLPLKLDTLGRRLEMAGWSGEVTLRPYCEDATDQRYWGRMLTFRTSPGVFQYVGRFGPDARTDWGPRPPDVSRPVWAVRVWWWRVRPWWWLVSLRVRRMRWRLSLRFHHARRRHPAGTRARRQ